MLNAFKLREITGRAPLLMRLAYLPQNNLYTNLMNSGSDALEAFKYKEIFERMTLDQIINIIGNHPRLASRITNMRILEKLTQEQLLILGKSPSIYRLIFEIRAASIRFTPNFWTALNDYHRDNVAPVPPVRTSHPRYDFASMFAQRHPAMYNDNSSAALYVLGESHPVNAVFILQNPELSSKLTLPDLVSLTVSCVEAVKIVSDTPALFNRVTQLNSGIPSLGVCKALLNGPLLRKLSDDMDDYVRVNNEIGDLIFEDLSKILDVDLANDTERMLRL